MLAEGAPPAPQDVETGLSGTISVARLGLPVVTLALAAIVIGLVNLEDFVAFGRGFSFSLPAAAKPGLYVRMRAVTAASALCGHGAGAAAGVAGGLNSAASARVS
jgi:hypothetical protein